jgi:hypothetical protein
MARRWESPQIEIRSTMLQVIFHLSPTERELVDSVFTISVAVRRHAGRFC